MTSRAPENTNLRPPQSLQLPRDHRRTSHDSASSATTFSNIEPFVIHAGSRTSLVKIGETWESLDSPITSSNGRLTSMSHHSVDLDAAKRRQQGFDEVSVYFDPQLMRAQKVWMECAQRIHPSLRRSSADDATIQELERAWEVIEKFAPPSIDAQDHPESLVGDQVSDHLSRRALACGPSLQIRLPLDDRHEHDSHHVERDPGALNSEEDYEDLYYMHASTARNLSDDLVNYGLSPDDYGALDSEGPESGAELSAPHLVPAVTFEHTDRLSKLIQDMKFHVREAKRYKDLCMENGIVLEDDEQEETLNDGEDVYATILPGVGRGIPRLDSILALSEHHRQRQDGPVAESWIRPAPRSKVLEWQSGVMTPPTVEADNEVSFHQWPAPPRLIVTRHSSRDRSAACSMTGSSWRNVALPPPHARHHRRGSDPPPETERLETVMLNNRPRSASAATFLPPIRIDSGLSFESTA